MSIFFINNTKNYPKNIMIVGFLQAAPLIVNMNTDYDTRSIKRNMTHIYNKADNSMADEEKFAAILFHRKVLIVIHLLLSVHKSASLCWEYI